MVECLPGIPKALGSVPGAEKEEKKPKLEKLLFSHVPGFVDHSGHYILDSTACVLHDWQKNSFLRIRGF